MTFEVGGYRKYLVYILVYNIYIYIWVLPKTWELQNLLHPISISSQLWGSPVMSGSSVGNPWIETWRVFGGWMCPSGGQGMPKESHAKMKNIDICIYIYYIYIIFIIYIIYIIYIYIYSILYMYILPANVLNHLDCWQSRRYFGYIRIKFWRLFGKAMWKLGFVIRSW